MEHLFNLLYNRTGGFILLYEFLIILSINYLGVILEKIFHLPTPGTVNGLILLFIFLSSASSAIILYQSISIFSSSFFKDSKIK